MLAHAGAHEFVGELLAGRFWWALPVAAAVLGVGVGWRALALPAAVWLPTAVYLVLNDGWHGFGWGEFGVLLNVVAAGAAFIAAGAGGIVRLGLHRARVRTPA